MCSPERNDAASVAPRRCFSRDKQSHVQVEVYSNSDCLSEIGDPTDFWSNRDFFLRVGLTGVVSIAPFFAEEAEVEVPPTGRGYVANKNKIVGMVRNLRAL